MLENPTETFSVKKATYDVFLTPEGQRGHLTLSDGVYTLINLKFEFSMLENPIERFFFEKSISMFF